MRGLVKSVAIGAIAGGGLPLIVTIPLGLSGGFEHLTSWPSAIYLAALPLLISLAFVLPSLVIVGFPMSIALRKLNADSYDTYVACGVAFGLLEPAAVLVAIGAPDGYWMCLFGALAGAATADTWWRSQEHRKGIDAQPTRWADRIKLISTLAFIVAGAGLIWLLNAPSQLSLDGVRYSVPKNVQFMPGLRSKGEVWLKLSGEDLAKHLGGYHATFRTVPGDLAPADIQVRFTSGHDFGGIKALAANQPGPIWTIPLKRLSDQDALAPGCTPIKNNDGSTSRLCQFTYWDSGKTLSFTLGEENLALAPNVARYASSQLERYRAH